MQQTLLLGVSGGPDSLCLLDVLWQMKVPIIVGHFNHGLRSEAESEVKIVAQEAARRGLSFITGKEDVQTYAVAHNLSIEEAARITRYQFLFEQAHKHQVAAVAVAHTADDQVETVLMHLLRGSGLSGLRGMPYRAKPNTWSKDIPLIRPMLGIWRQQVLAYLAEHGLQPTQDLTNQDTYYFRNRLRLELIPYLETYNPHLKNLVWNTADILREDYAVIEAVAESAWQTICQEVSPEYLILDLTAMRAVAPALQRWLIRYSIACLCPGVRDVDFESVQRAVIFLNHPSRTGRYDLMAGLQLLVENQHLILTKQGTGLPDQEWPQISSAASLQLPVPGQIDLGAGWILTVKQVIADDRAFTNTDPYLAWLSLPESPIRFTVRARRPGERFHPFGFDGHSIKISDFMINRHLPRRARQRWPLVCAGNEIVWIPGLRSSHFLQLTEVGQKALLLSLRQEK